MSKQNKKGQRDVARPENKVNAFDDVVALIKERRKYADWITALEGKKDQTPAAVYAKVHLDYETRLQSVVDKLAAYRGTLTEEQAGLEKRLAEVGEEIERQVEERSETEVRAHVGELTAAALTEALRVADTEIERLEAKRASIETDLARIAEFFSAADGTGTVPSPAPKPKSGGFDELSFLNSVVGAEKGQAGQAPTAATTAESPPPLKPVEVPPTPPAEVPAPARPSIPAPAPSRPSTPPPAPPPTPEPPTVPVAPPRTSIEKPTPAPAPMAAAQADGALVEKAAELETAPLPKPIPRQSIAMQMAELTIEPGAKARAQPDLGIIKTGDELPPSILADLRPGEGADKPLAANVASNNPFTLTSAPNSTKSLKCKECGAMNLSSEWYCERCGAELSVI